MKPMTEGNFSKAKFKIKPPKINRGTLIFKCYQTELSQKYYDTNGGELLLMANSS